MAKRGVTIGRMLLKRLQYTLEGAGIMRPDLHKPQWNERQTQNLEQFRAQKLGMFIHFNSATYQFANNERDDWSLGIVDNRDSAYRDFPPGDFTVCEPDFNQWAQVAKSAGCGFCVLTAKHHEGFALWPSEATPHSVKHAPFCGDLVRGYVDTMRANGLLPGLYYSMLDLHHNITELGVSPEQKQLILTQLTELLTQYGEIPYLVIDGWHSDWGGPRFSQLDYAEIAAHIHALQPDILIMNHACECSYEHTDVIFFENAAGQSVPKDFDGYGAAGNILTKTWFWKESHPTAALKTAKWAVEEKLRPMNASGVTFLLNVSPNPQGRIEKNVAQVFAQLGELRKDADTCTSQA